MEAARRRRVGRHEHRARDDAAQRLGGVVAAEAGAALAVLDVDRRLEEGRVRARGGIDDRVRPLLLDLVVVPVRLLAAAVLEQRDLARPGCQRPRGVFASKAICMPSQSPSWTSLNWLK